MDDGAALDLPGRPPYILRGRVLTALDDGGTRFEADGAVEVGADGRISWVGRWSEWSRSGHAGTGPALAAASPGGAVVAPAGASPAGAVVAPAGAAPANAGSAEAEVADLSMAAPPADMPVIDLRPWLLMPGMVDLHAHLPQLPNAGLGAGLHLLDWLERYIFPLEEAFDAPTAERVAPTAYRAFAHAGTTTTVLYGAVYEPSLDVAFRAAEAHGIRAVIGKVMMDRLTYDDRLTRDRVLDVSLQQSADLCARWHGRDGGRLRYAFTPRFAVSCTAEMLRESARLAAETGAYWMTHLSEDRDEGVTVAELFPDALDYLDVYDRAGGLGPRSLFAHAIHLSAREIGRLHETGSNIAHCPASNLFLASGAMPLARYLEAGLSVGLGSDVAAGPTVSIFDQMRAGAYTQSALRTAGDPHAILTPLDWLRVGSLDGARALGMDTETGSLEAGKDADLIAVDAALTAPLAGIDSDDPDELASRLIFRAHPDMVRAAWVRGRLLPA